MSTAVAAARLPSPAARTPSTTPAMATIPSFASMTRSRKRSRSRQNGTTPAVTGAIVTPLAVSMRDPSLSGQLVGGGEVDDLEGELFAATVGLEFPSRG